MYNSRKKPLEEVQQELTTIWSCTNEHCNGWIRDNFSFSAQPQCPQCGHDMAKTEKMLPVVVNTSPTQSKD
ncbi:cold-shock protein [Cohnella nanjingensis]|uniref:Cold-shock protein n=1 Tax=Cohnella nanjingensis TaxID=1387779 RepID=A0A7X0RTT6_9BACL|nr:cold-shock protein [Cohnella nanjingensis]MBB6673559.1 cold-shock protein [Cohnella nanjingensis]